MDRKYRGGRQGLGGGRMGSCVMWTESLWEDDKSSRALFHNNVNIFNTTELYTEKMVNVSFFFFLTTKKNKRSWKPHREGSF